MAGTRDGLHRTSAMPAVRVRGQRILPHQDLYHHVLTSSWPAFFVWLVLAFVAGNAAFAGLYLLQPGGIANVRPGSFEDAFFFSVQTWATIGYGGMMPVTRYAHVLVTIEAVIGILGSALITGLTFAKFARPTARVLFTDRMVITPRDGVPHLQVRTANWRRNRVVEAQLRMLLLVDERTREGDFLRRTLDLELVRDRTQLFVLSWTAMHRIDARSPFHGEGALARLRALRAEIVCSLVGYDETFGQTIHAAHRYTLDDVVCDARFADVLTLEDDGTRVVDYTRFHEIVPIAQGTRGADAIQGGGVVLGPDADRDR